MSASIIKLPRISARKQFRSFSSKLQRAPASSFRDDFSHHAEGIARLNHGSFGAVPAPVLEAEAEARAKWRANPDSFYFGGELEMGIVAAEDAAAKLLGAAKGSVALVENATVATLTVARRWERVSRVRGTCKRAPLLARLVSHIGQLKT